MTGISVLMSVYEKEKPEYLREALDSIYAQTLLPDEIVLVEDGPLTDALSETLAAYPKLTRVKLTENVQLGRALEAGLKKCSFDLVARMDTDDIAVPERLRIQKEYMEAHPDICVVGGDIEEFNACVGTIDIKHMPDTHEELYRYGKFRNPLNHMTVMFRKDVVENAGGYQHFPLLEDYHLWIRLMSNGIKMENIPEVLVRVRVNEEFANKRGGLKYCKRYLTLRKLQLKCGYTKWYEYVIGEIITISITLVPATLRNSIYRVLRIR